VRAAIRLVCVVVVAVGALAFAGEALADADPASDVLAKNDLFLPLTQKVSGQAEAELRAAIRRAGETGRPVRVALIAEPSDLGGVSQLFGNPVLYARFLDIEIEFYFPGRVLVVMPQGVGLAKGGRLVADKGVVAAKPGSSGDDLAETATQLVEEISTGRAAPLLPDTPLTLPAGVRRAGPGSNPLHRSASSSKGLPVGLVTGIVIFAVLVSIGVAGVVLARRGRRVETGGE
jgi:hypothetical protein